MPKWRKRLLILLAIVAAAVLGLALYIDDWSRDFTTNTAEISEHSKDPTLRPLIVERSLPEVVEVIKAASRRIRDWEFVGDAGDQDTAVLLFVRTSRIWRFKDDVTMRVEDLGDRCAITGESRSRVGVGDLGQNPRTLRRILREIRAVLDGSK